MIPPGIRPSLVLIQEHMAHGKSRSRREEDEAITIAMEGAGREKTVCVTGAGGFVASWLVKLLLSRGRYTVHGTVRDPGDGKNAHLAALDGAAERLRLFKADLLDNGSLAAAITGCDDVFHVACPVLANATPYPEVELLAPVVTGTMNILKACSDAKVKRVVVVSSVSAVMVNPNWPEGKAMDEDCWSDVEYCRTIENWYSLSKTLAELEALDYAKRSGLDVVTVCPSLVIGPLLQSTVNASSSVIVDYLKGDREVKSKLRCFVDVRDVANALLLVYETPEASGRYICNSHSRKVSDVIDLLKSLYPTYKFANRIQDDNILIFFFCRPNLPKMKEENTIVRNLSIINHRTPVYIKMQDSKTRRISTLIKHKNIKTLLPSPKTLRIMETTLTTRIQTKKAKEMMKHGLVFSCSSLALVQLTPSVLACILYYLSLWVISDAHGFPQSFACGEMCYHPFASVIASATFVM